MGVFKKEIQVNCPIEGKVYPLEYCPDEVFFKRNDWRRGCNISNW